MADYKLSTILYSLDSEDNFCSGCDNENRQCAQNHCPKGGVNNIREFVTRDTETWRCPYLPVSGLILEKIYEVFVGLNGIVRY